MTGRIKSLETGSASGFIESENDARFHFDPGAVLAYDAGRLAAGQLVTFDVERGSEAVNICLQRSHPVAHADGKRKEATVRYMGFDQIRGIRTYRYERTSFGEKTETFSVTTDMALFTKHRIGIQEGPSLCLNLLVVGLSPMGEGLHLERSLTEQDILTYLASKPDPAAKRHNRFPRPAPAVGAH